MRSWYTCILFAGQEGVPIGLLGSCHYWVTSSKVTPDQPLPGVLRNEIGKQQICTLSSRGSPSPCTPIPPPHTHTHTCDVLQRSLNNTGVSCVGLFTCGCVSVNAVQYHKYIFFSIFFLRIHYIISIIYKMPVSGLLLVRLLVNNRFLM